MTFGNELVVKKEKTIALSVVKEEEKEEEVVDCTLEEFAFLIKRF